MLDPISYSLAKKALKQTKPVIPSSEEIDLDNNFWFDLNTNNLKTYHFTRDKWAVIKKYVGYDGFDNNLENGVWVNYINIPISTPPTESTQYKIEISGDSINIYSNDGTSILTSGTGGLEFWSKVSPTGYDIRVFDETLSQNYFWIEKWDYANQEAIIWVAINAGQDQINIAYNNTDCLPSNYNNGDNVFLFFDDFNGTSLDTNKWVILQGTATESNSVLSIGANSVLDSKYPILSGSFILEFDVLSAADLAYNIFSLDTAQSTSEENVCRLYTGDPGWGNEGLYIEGTTTQVNAQPPKHIKIIRTPTKWIVYFNDTLISSGSVITTSNLYIEFGRYTGGGSGTYDNVFVRKYISTDLTFGTPTIKQF